MVEVIRTALTAEFLEYVRDGEVRVVRGKAAGKAKKGKTAVPRKAAKKPAAKQAAKRRAK